MLVSTSGRHSWLPVSFELLKDGAAKPGVGVYRPTWIKHARVILKYCGFYNGFVGKDKSLHILSQKDNILNERISEHFAGIWQKIPLRPR